MTAPAADVIIIGGGITGASLAWHLARRGAGRVVVLERSVVGAGASGKTGAMLRRHYTNRPEAMLAQAGWETYAHWPDIVGEPAVHDRHGLIVTVAGGPGFAANIDRFHQNIAMQNALGIPSQAITAAELRAMQPYAASDDTLIAYEPDTGSVDALAATRGMARAAQRAGAMIREGTAVTGLTLSADGSAINGVTTADGPLTAPTVIVAAGPWSTRLLATAGVTVPISALRVQVAILQRPLACEPPHFAYIDTTAGIFCRPWQPGRTLIGVSGGDQHEPVDPDTYNPYLDPSYPALAISAIARRFPAMAQAVALHGHAGMYDMTPDGHPILGAAGPLGLHLLAGFSGAGFKKAPAAAQAIAELIVDGGATVTNLAPFALDRFATDAWHQPWSDTEYVLSSDFGHGF